MQCLNPLLDLNPELTSAKLVAAINEDRVKEPEVMQDVMTEVPKGYGVIGYFDGGCSKGRTASAFAIYDGNNNLLHKCSYKDVGTTSNQAEYWALIGLLTYLKSKYTPGTKILVRGDS